MQETETDQTFLLKVDAISKVGS